MTVEGNQPLSAKGPTTKAESTGKNLFNEKEPTHFSPITNSPTPPFSELKKPSGC